MEAPEKIWINSYQDLPCSNVDGNSIEYTRTDAFIEKAAEWLFNQANYYTKLKIDAHNGGVYADFYADKMVDEFRKYMEGE